MSTEFITFTLRQVRISLAEVTYDSGLTRSSETVPQSAARRFRAHVKQLAIIICRLIMLMALNLTLDPVAPRDRSAISKEDEPVVTKAQTPFSIALSGQTPVYAPDGPGSPENAESASGPVSVASLMRRFEALARILRNPEKYAVRVARVMARRRRAGAPLPVCAPIPTYRLKPELGTAAAALPMLLTKGLSQWNDSS